MLNYFSRALQVRTSFLCLALVSANLLAIKTVSAEALLQILPTRVVLDDKTRTSSLTLVNQGDEDTSYRMFFRNIRMSETGRFNIITDEDDVSGERFADQMLRFSPRRITIPARGKQTIRVVARKPHDLEKGEYRSHLVFRRLPPQTSVLDREANTQLQLAIKPVVEVTIPVIVRHQEPSATLGLSDVVVTIPSGLDNSTDADQTTLSVAINREGERSLYGDLNIHWDPNNGDSVKIGEAKGISVYYPNKRRIFELPLKLSGSDEAPILLEDGTLNISFRENPIYGGEQSATISLDR